MRLSVQVSWIVLSLDALTVGVARQQPQEGRKNSPVLGRSRSVLRMHTAPRSLPLQQVPPAPGCDSVI